MKHLFFTLFLLVSTTLFAKARNYDLSSVNNKLEVKIEINNQISYSISLNGIEIISPSKISMTLENGQVLGKDPRVKKVSRYSHSGTVEAPFHRNQKIEELYNQIDIRFRQDFGVIFRAYNEGVSYRFYTLIDGEIKIIDECAEFNFGADNLAHVAYTNSSPDSKTPYTNSFENRYAIQKISELDKVHPIITPLLVTVGSSRVLITESDLESYPGMFLSPTENGFKNRHAPIPSKTKIHPTRCEEQVVEYSSILARTSGDRTFPWRIIAIAQRDIDLPTNNLVYLLGSKSRIDDVSWIKPGRVAWDWWNNWGITGVDFKAGINTQTYKYYIDFAASNDLEYIIMDEGWYNPKEGDMLKVIPEIDLEELIRYGKSKNVDIILWGVAFSFDQQMEEICKYYSKMGIKGFKIDFLNRDDQLMVDLVYRMLETTAKHKLVLNLHGMYKPTGLNRTYPNLLNYEGVWGLEQMKWSKEDMVTYDVTMPYIRMVAGPVDYTQGAMRNVGKSEYYPNWNNPMSQGTRARQVATYIVFDSPLVMFCDNPTAYMKEKQTTDYICKIPSVFEETRIISGKLGEYIVTARKANNKWYIAGLTDWSAREITLDLSEFSDILKTGETKYSLSIFRDGVNIEKNASDYIQESKTVSSDESITIPLSAGGGFAIIMN